MAGVGFVGVGIIAAYWDKGADVVRNSITMKNVVFPGHIIPLGYAAILISFCIIVEKGIHYIAGLKNNKHNH
jgi:hypothetical protein